MSHDKCQSYRISRTGRGRFEHQLVYIKRIDLRGFKTFGKKATIHLGRGLTLITGPNGSGKSNILDAVKFALGELSPKELRGETISDLVHKGPQQVTFRSAYVAVQFDNHDRRIPIDSAAKASTD
jgi:chromosome segregation protein